MEYGQGYEDREQRGAERREEFAAPYQQAQPAPQAGSPSASASPFAFAPPPLSSRPPPPVPMHQHHSDPTNAYPYYQQRPPIGQTQSYPYPAAASAPMGAYRSYSNDSSMPAQRASPQTMNRTPSLSIIPTPSNLHSQAPSPTSAQSPYPYARQVSNSSQPYGGQASPQRGHVYPNGYYAPPPHLQSVDMPRSSSYPSYAQPYPSPTYHHPGMQHHPGLMRHNTTEGMGHGMDMGMRPSMGYSFANRLPLVDRPFKCDECVQSFNRNHDLKRHKRIHLSVKPFGCDKCGKTFSRKDALRRHWLVKGCRGEDGATAPIVPLFPINISRPPALSPPSPSQNSPLEASDPSRSYGHAPPPAPLHTLPTRHSQDNQIIVTPDELAAQGNVRSEPMIASLDEPMSLDGSGMNPNGSHRGSASSMHGESYFDVGVKEHGMVDQTPGAINSPYTRYPHSPASAPTYRRDGALDSPRRVLASPTAPYMQQSRSYSPSGMVQSQSQGADGRPVFAMPFAPNGYVAQDGLLGPPIDGGAKMERNASHDSADAGTWQRWHRPSFPFPPPPGVNYNTYEQTSSPADGVPAARPGFAQ